MLHPFAALCSEYTTLWQTMEITRLAEAELAAKQILGILRYARVNAKTKVPIVWLGPIDKRESDCNPTTYLGNGDRLDRPTKDVPRDRGPFESWDAGAEDALELDRITTVTDWSIERGLFEAELWNGFGPRDRGIHTGYLWAGTKHYKRGKYIADGKWSAFEEDKQLGVAPIMWCLMQADPSLALPPAAGAIAGTKASLFSRPLPTGLGGGPRDTKWIQNALNKLGEALTVDGDYGRATRRAVCAFQQSHNLDVDGFAGPKTIAALEQIKAGQAA